MNNLTVRKGLNFFHQPVCQFTVCITLTSFFTPCTKLSSIVESFMNLAACISKFVHKYFCLFVWFEFFVPLEIFSPIWRRPHNRLRAANFDLCSAFMVIEHRGFFSVPHVLWHGASVYKGHLRGPVTLTPNAERLAIEAVTTCFNFLGLSRLGCTQVCCDSNLRGINHMLFKRLR